MVLEWPVRDKVKGSEAPCLPGLRRESFLDQGIRGAFTLAVWEGAGCYVTGRQSHKVSRPQVFCMTSGGHLAQQLSVSARHVCAWHSESCLYTRWQDVDCHHSLNCETGLCSYSSCLCRSGLKWWVPDPFNQGLVS